MNKNVNLKNSGFTLIELLVVIAIIGILSAIVLASLGSARGNAREASILSSLNSARTQAEIYHVSNGSYAGLCSDSKIQEIVASLTDTGDGAACWEVTEDYSNWKAQLKMRDYGIGVSYNDRYYAASPQSSVVFAEEGELSGGGTINWNDAKQTCSDAGQRLPTPSELAAVYDTVGNTPDGFQPEYYHAVFESPRDTDESLGYYMDSGGGYLTDVGKTWNSYYAWCVE